MNVLIFDYPPTLAHFVKSTLLSQGHRVAIATDPDDAALKLDTTLFDALVFGPSGGPQVLADFVQERFPSLPIVLAGVPVEAPAQGQIVAVLPAPLSARRLLMIFRRIEHERLGRIGRVPVQVAAEGLAIACRLADLTPDTMVLAGDSDEFHRYFGASRPERIQALVWGTPLGGEVAQIETDVPRHVRRVNVRLAEGDAREILARLTTTA